MEPEAEHIVSFTRGGLPYLEGRFSVYDENNVIRLTLALGAETFTAEADDCFEAFCAIRRTLEADQIFPHCSGAVMNVFPSGMSRSMVAGMKGYRLTLGKQALMKDLVGIFDAEAKALPTTVAEQDEFAF
jgi:hypothetical protein